MDDMDKLKNIEIPGKSVLLKGKRYFPTLWTTYSKEGNSDIINDILFSMGISDDTDKNADPDSSLGETSICVLVNKNLSDITFKRFTNDVLRTFQRGYSGVFNEENLYRMYLPLWNNTKKYINRTK